MAGMHPEEQHSLSAIENNEIMDSPRRQPPFEVRAIHPYVSRPRWYNIIGWFKYWLKL